MSAPGFIILAHQHLRRAAELARALARIGPVVIHVDAKVQTPDLPTLTGQIRVVSTRKCHWGMIGLVDATLDCARLLLQRHDVSHVCLLSGSCLPIRPLRDLPGFLDAQPKTDFIESVSPAGSAWIKGGLGEERFTLYFPVGWTRRRRLFDWLVDLQRRWRVRRRIPARLQPHLGLQWWCLTRMTLTRILDHPRLPEWRRYFAWTWIPDESFFQTLARHVATGTVRSQSLTLQRFDKSGKPFVFHDDHVDLLTGSDHFFARKIDPDASALYARFLSEEGACKAVGSDTRGKFSGAAFEAAANLCDAKDRGLLGASRMPWSTTRTEVETARPYLVVVSANGDLLARIRAEYRSRKLKFHGRLFGPSLAQIDDDFSGSETPGPGCLPKEAVQRDYRPAQYLARLLWVGRDRPTAFLFDPADNPFIRTQILSDPNARLILIGDVRDLVSRLDEPPRNRRGQPIASPPRRAWFRFIHPDAGLIRNVVQALDADLDDPTGWTVPGSAGYPA